MRRRWLPLGLILASGLLSAVAPPAAAQAFQRCTVCSAGCPYACTGQQTPSSGGSGSSLQQMQLDAASNLGQAVGAGLVRMLTAPGSSQPRPTRTVIIVQPPEPYRADLERPKAIEEAQAKADDPCAASWNSCADALAAQGDALSEERMDCQDLSKSLMRGLGKAAEEEGSAAIGGFIEKRVDFAPKPYPDGRPAYEYAPDPSYDADFTRKKSSFESVADAIGQIADSTARSARYQPKSRNLLEYGLDEAKAAGPGELKKKWEGLKEKRAALDRFQHYLDAVMACAKRDTLESINACNKAVREETDKAGDDLLGQLGKLPRALASEARETIKDCAKTAMAKSEGLIGRGAECMGSCR